ncbi:MAG: TonB-dependent receptor [Bacteroidales bacterium]|nr:TonB-dependent receptor [Bacteroidales bacterium]
MKTLYYGVLLIFILFSVDAFAQRTDANVIGHVVDSEGEHIPFATIVLENTTIGTSTDETGHFTLINMPLGKQVVKASAIGYKPVTRTIELKGKETVELKFDLEQDVLGLEQVVVTADRNDKHRTNASVIVNTITPKLFEVAQTATISDGLNFCPGLRMENNCQNCGFSQVRMNGMEGPYSQILINSRPIFSGLAGVYGLELIPSNMIERMEVIRGGGSALYGSNAIAGTINLILKDPINNSYEAGITSGYTGVGLKGAGDPAFDYNLDFNTSLVSSDSKTGMALYGYNRDHDAFDANNDGFSEITSINNITLGTRIYHRFGHRNKLALDFFTINEKRRGGDSLNLPEHESNIAESVKHKITTGALSFDQFFRESDKLSLYLSGQNIDRDSYYGAGQSLKDYGKTEGFTYIFGGQYTANFENSSLIGGVEYKGETLYDQKLAYKDIDSARYDKGKIIIPEVGNRVVADQESNIFGAFAQYEYNFDKLSVSAGVRYDRYVIKDLKKDSDETGNVLSPRVTVKYDILKSLQGRVSYSKGYRAPQIFDEDLHIETSDAMTIIHKNSENLKQETSHSYMASLDFNKRLGNVNFGFLVEGFYTKLDDPFKKKNIQLEENPSLTIRLRENGEGAVINGINTELNLAPINTDFTITGGFTFQKSRYEKNQEDFPVKDFFRTPETYGYLTLDWDFMKGFCMSATGNYTGSMLVPYYGVKLPETKREQGVLRESDPFFDLGAKLSYKFRLNGASMKIFVGMKNIFNSYQDDFDSTKDRDPGYIYGPSLPRSIYFGIRIGNLL